MATYNYTPAPKASLFKGRFGGFVNIRKAATANKNSSTISDSSCKPSCKPVHSLFKGRFGGFVNIEAKRFEIGRNRSTDECLTLQH